MRPRPCELDISTSTATFAFARDAATSTVYWIGVRLVKSCAQKHKQMCANPQDGAPISFREHHDDTLTRNCAITADASAWESIYSHEHKKITIELGICGGSGVRRGG